MKKISLLYWHSSSKRKYLFTIQYTTLNVGKDVRITCYIEASHPHNIPWLNIRSFEAEFLNRNGTYDFVLERRYTDFAEVSLLMNSLCKTIMKNEQLTARIAKAVSEGLVGELAI